MVALQQQNSSVLLMKLSKLIHITHLVFEPKMRFYDMSSICQLQGTVYFIHCWFFALSNIVYRVSIHRLYYVTFIIMHVMHTFKICLCTVSVWFLANPTDASLFTWFAMRIVWQQIRMEQNFRTIASNLNVSVGMLHRIRI